LALKGERQGVEERRAESERSDYEDEDEDEDEGKLGEWRGINRLTNTQVRLASRAFPAT